MGADQIAVFRPVIAEVYDAPSDDWCATFEIPGTELWVQVMRHVLNASYPHQDDPRQRFAPLATLFPDLDVTDWEAGTFATFAHGQGTADEIAMAVDAMFCILLGNAEADYEVDAKVEEL